MKKLLCIVCGLVAQAAQAQTLQEKIDALPRHSGGVVEVGLVMLTEPLDISNRSNVTLVGKNFGASAINGDFDTPGPVIYVGGASNIRIVDLRIQGIRNTECGVLLCRQTFNGNGATNTLDRLNIQGNFGVGCIVSIGSENLEIRNCRLNPRLPDSFGWWTSTSEIPRYRPEGNRRPKQIQAPGPIAGGTNSGTRILGGYIASSAKGVTSIRVGGTADLPSVHCKVDNVFISNSASWHPTEPPIGKACIEVGHTSSVVIDNIKSESPDCAVGLKISGKSVNLDVRASRFGGRTAFEITDDGELWSSKVDRTNAFTSFDGNRFKPLKCTGVIQHTILDISGYVD